MTPSFSGIANWDYKLTPGKRSHSDDDGDLNGEKVALKKPNNSL